MTPWELVQEAMNIAGHTYKTVDSDVHVLAEKVA